MSKQKTIIFDIDGTAIDSPGQKLPSSRLVTAAERVKSQYNLCAATGRVWSFAEPVLKGMGLVDPCIISSGTQICNPATGEILWQCDLDSADLVAAENILKQYPECRVLCNDYVENDYLYGGIEPKDLSVDGPVYFLEQIFVPQTMAPEIISRLSAIEGLACTLVVAQRPGYNDIHITNRNATKEQAVGELLRILGVDREEAIGVGDGPNDVHLFRAVQTKVAMGNAAPELKDMADSVIGDVTDDGFAAYLESLI